MNKHRPNFKVGIVGSGGMAEVHIQAIRKIRSWQLSGIYSHYQVRAQYLAQKYGNLRVVEDYDDLVEDCDIVDIVTKNNTHLDYAEKPLASNKHIIIEKPVDVDVRKAMRFLDKMQRSNSKVTVIAQNRFNENVRRFIQDKNSAKLGDIFYIRMSLMWKRGQDYYAANQAWRGRRAESGGGVVLHQGIHLIDLLLWMFGDVQQVYSFVRTLQGGIEVEDLATASILMANGILVNLNFSTFASCNFPFLIEVFGTRASAVICGDNGYRIILANSCEKASLLQRLAYKLRFNFDLSFSRRLKEGSVLDQLKCFSDDIVYDRNKTQNFSSAVKALRCAQQIIKGGLGG